MKKSIQEMQEQLINSGLINIFEMEVTDTRTNEIDWVTFDISIQGHSLVGQHIPLNDKENRSKKIAHKSIVIDDCFSLDENLQELHEECTTAINESEYFNLKE